MNGASHAQLLAALSAVAQGEAPTPDAAAAAESLGLLGNGELSADGRRLVEEGLLRDQPEVTRQLFAAALVEHPVSRAFLEGSWGEELSRDRAEKVLRYAFPPSRAWKQVDFTRLFDAMNYAGLISYSRKASQIRVRGGQPSVSAPATSSPIAPSTPYRNKRLLAAIVAGAKDRLYWFDAHFTRQGIVFIYQEATLETVRTIHILSCGRSELTPASLDDYRRIRDELGLRDVAIEWRTLVDRDDFSDKHDRWLLADNQLWNVPPFTAVMTGKWGTILRDGSDPPLAEWWDRASHVLDVVP